MRFKCEIWCSQNSADQDSYNVVLSNGKYCQTFRETFCCQSQGSSIVSDYHSNSLFSRLGATEDFALWLENPELHKRQLKQYL